MVTEPRYEIIVCLGPTCGDERGARDVYDEVCALVSSSRLDDRVDIRWQSCFGRCSRGPVALVREQLPSAEPLFLHAPVPSAAGARAAMCFGVRPADAAFLIQTHVLDRAIVHHLADDSNRRSFWNSERPVASERRARAPGADGEE